MKKLAKIAFVLILVVVGIPYAIGAFFLSEELSAQTPMTVDRPVEMTWERLLDFEAHPVTGDRMEAREPRPEANGLPVWIEDMGESEILVTTVERVAEEKLVLTLADQATPMTARWTFTLEGIPGGTRIVLDATTRLPSGAWQMPMFRFLMTVAGGQDSVNRDFLERVATTLGTEGRFR